jgi:hypothetical protein
VLRLKDLRGRVVGERVDPLGGKILRELEHRFDVGRLEGWEGWEERDKMVARCGWETGGRRWDSIYTGEDSMGVARG